MSMNRKPVFSTKKIDMNIIRTWVTTAIFLLQNGVPGATQSDAEAVRSEEATQTQPGAA